MGFSEKNENGIEIPTDEAMDRLMQQPDVQPGFEERLTPFIQAANKNPLLAEILFGMYPTPFALVN